MDYLNLSQEEKTRLRQKWLSKYTPSEILASYTPSEILENYTPSQVLENYSVEQFLSGLSANQLKDLINAAKKVRNNNWCAFSLYLNPILTSGSLVFHFGTMQYDYLKLYYKPDLKLIKIRYRIKN